MVNELRKDLMGLQHVDERTHFLKGVQARISDEGSLLDSAMDDRKTCTGTDAEAESVSGEGQNSMAFTCAVFINSIIGGSLVSMPFVLREAGLILGGALIVVVALITAVSLVLQISAGRAVRANTYQETTEALLGRPGFFICALLQFLLPFVVLISDYIIVGDTATKLILRMTDLDPSSVYVGREFINGLATLFVTIPLSLMRDLTCVSRVSFISLGLVLVITVCMIVRAPVMSTLASTHDSPVIYFDRNFGPAASIMNVAYVCHHASFIMYRSLEDNTMERWTTTTHIALGTSALISVTVAVAGYVSFRDLTQGDILENYCWTDDVMNVCRLLSCVTILVTFPVDCLSAREVLETSFFRHAEEQTLRRRVGLTLAIIVSALLLSFSTDCLAVVLQVIGVFVTCPLAFILPGLCFLRASTSPLFCKDTCSAWAVITFGVFTSACGLVTIVVNAATVAQCSHGVEMPYCFILPNESASHH